MKLELAVKEFLKEIEIRKYTPKTIKGYRNNLSLFLRFCEEQGAVEVEDVCYPIIKQFMEYLTRRGNKGTYINSLLKVVKSFVTYCYNEGYGGFNTRHKFVWAKEDKPIVRAFKPEHIKMMLDSCRGRDLLSLRDKAILTMFIETGIRCWELCCIKKEDVHEDFIIINGKNHKQRVSPITAPLSKAMIKYEVARDDYYKYKPCEYYFVSFHGYQLTNSAVEHIVKRHCEGIEGIRLSPHTLRHTFAQQHIKMGTDLYTISRLLGHESIGITQTYLNSLRDEEVIEIAKHRSVLSSL